MVLLEVLSEVERFRRVGRIRGRKEMTNILIGFAVICLMCVVVQLNRIHHNIKQIKYIFEQEINSGRPR